jgi:hypothetical protein
MRKQWWAFALPVMMACSNSSPTSPTQPASPQFSIKFTLANPAGLSLSEPMPCPGDWSTCPRDSQPQGPVLAGTITTRHYRLPPGTYRLTGVLQPTTSTGASVGIEIGRGATGSTGGGVVREGPVLGFVAFTGEPTPPVSSVISHVCGAIFSNASGALEWSVTFRVIATSESLEQLCV